MRVRIKQYSPCMSYSFHAEIAGKEFDATVSRTDMYAVRVGALSPESDQDVWAFDPKEIEVIS